MWVGLASQQQDGNVTTSYPTAYMNSLGGGDWGGQPMNTSAYVFGFDRLFEADCYGSRAIMQPGTCPKPTTPETENAFFNNVGALLSDAFSHARRLQIMTSVGTESPLHIPPPAAGNASDYYLGIFTRMQAAYGPVDYYWIWTSEGWSARSDAKMPVTDPAIRDVVQDMLAAHDARLRGNFTSLKLATCGWTVGPMVNRAYFDQVLPDDFTITSINEALGNTNCEPAYANMTKPRWSIPWMEGWSIPPSFAAVPWT